MSKIRKQRWIIYIPLIILEVYEAIRSFLVGDWWFNSPYLHHLQFPWWIYALTAICLAWAAWYLRKERNAA